MKLTVTYDTVVNGIRYPTCLRKSPCICLILVYTVLRMFFVDTFSKIRETQQVKAALNLLGVEFNKGGLDETMSGKVEYKMKHIRHQNKRLNFGNTRKHIRFDEDGLSRNYSGDLVQEQVENPFFAAKIRKT